MGQIVDDLDGTISVRSKLGIGTEVTVNLPLLKSNRMLSEEPSSTTSNPLSFEDALRATKGLRIALIGFSPLDGDALQSQGTEPGSQEREKMQSGLEMDQQWCLSRKEIGEICCERLAMEVLPAETNVVEPSRMTTWPDLLLVMQQNVEQLVSDLTAVHAVYPSHRQSGRAAIPPIVVVCGDMPSAKARSAVWNNQRAMADWISQPCGPRKLAKIFALSMTRWSRERDRTPDYGSPAPGRQTSAQDLLVDAQILTGGSTAVASAGLETAVYSLSLYSSSHNEAPDTDTAVDKFAFLLVEDNPINLKVGERLLSCRQYSASLTCPNAHP